jgi:hypothetical protein
MVFVLFFLGWIWAYGAFGTGLDLAKAEGADYLVEELQKKIFYHTLILGTIFTILYTVMVKIEGRKKK